MEKAKTASCPEKGCVKTRTFHFSHFVVSILFGSWVVCKCALLVTIGMLIKGALLLLWMEPCTFSVSEASHPVFWELCIVLVCKADVFLQTILSFHELVIVQHSSNCALLTIGAQKWNPLYYLVVCGLLLHYLL